MKQEWTRHALEMERKVLGEDHLNTSTTLTALEWCTIHKGRMKRPRHLMTLPVMIKKNHMVMRMRRSWMRGRKRPRVVKRKYFDLYVRLVP
jgi:hypothetical protein